MSIPQRAWRRGFTENLNSQTAEYVVSVWNYDRLATLLLSAFVLHPPRRHRVIVTVCYCPEDKRTVDTLAWFSADRAPQNVAFNFVSFERPQLMRRAIARNQIARSTTADWVMFADVDYIPLHDSIDLAVDLMASSSAEHGPAIMFPRMPMMSLDHAAGDSEIARVEVPGIYGLDVQLYAPSPLNRPIGGCQWVSGDVARQYGYLPNHPKFQLPAAEWQRTFCDPEYRRELARHGIGIRPLDVPSIFRVRHSQRGRFDIGVRL